MSHSLRTASFSNRPPDERSLPGIKDAQAGNAISCVHGITQKGENVDACTFLCLRFLLYSSLWLDSRAIFRQRDSKKTINFPFISWKHIFFTACFPKTCSLGTVVMLVLFVVMQCSAESITEPNFIVYETNQSPTKEQIYFLFVANAAQKHLMVCSNTVFFRHVQTFFFLQFSAGHLFKQLHLALILMLINNIVFVHTGTAACAWYACFQAFRGLNPTNNRQQRTICPCRSALVCAPLYGASAVKLYGSGAVNFTLRACSIGNRGLVTYFNKIASSPAQRPTLAPPPPPPALAHSAPQEIGLLKIMYSDQTAAGHLHSRCPCLRIPAVVSLSDCHEKDRLSHKSVWWWWCCGDACHWDCRL